MLFTRLSPFFKRPSGRSRWLILFSLLLLAACGGGGGGPSASLPPAPGTGSGDQALGTPAPVTDSQINSFASGTIRWTGNAPIKSSSHQVTAVPMGYIEAADTNARYAWKQGWTGKGQTIAVIDDFNKVNAGGAHQLIPEGAEIYETLLPDFCNDNNCFSGLATLNSVTPSYGVAKDATIEKVSVDLSSRQNPANTLNDIMKAVEKHYDKASMNLSLSGPVPSSQTSFAAVAADFAGRGHITSKSEAVIVVALGNQNGQCRQNSMTSTKCNRIGVAFTHMDQLKDSTILVGALTGKERASYSNKAGDLKAFTLFAQDTASFSGLNETEKQGTSFAAPRVAGAAAILRHKWPKQTAAQITRLLLDTASTDINQDGTADFTGVHDIYGHGRLDLKAALSPVGGLK